MEERIAALEKRLASMATWAERKNRQMEHLQQEIADLRKALAGVRQAAEESGETVSR